LRDEVVYTKPDQRLQQTHHKRRSPSMTFKLVLERDSGVFQV